MALIALIFTGMTLLVALFVLWWCFNEKHHWQVSYENEVQKSRSLEKDFEKLAQIAGMLTINTNAKIVGGDLGSSRYMVGSKQFELETVLGTTLLYQLKELVAYERRDQSNLET